MKKVLLSLTVILFAAVSIFAQCDKKIKYQGSKAELLDEKGNVVDTKSGSILVTTDAKNITLDIVENPNDKLEGTINGTECDWKEAFKVGKTALKVNVVTQNGETSAGTLTVEGKDGKLTITFQMDVMQGKSARIYVDKYEVI
jgi:hypothetical protein